MQIILFISLIILGLFANSCFAVSKISRAAEEMAKKLPLNTKKMVHAMDATGMPKEAIAERIKYAAGGNKAHAERLVDAIKAEGRANAKKRK